MKYCAACGSGLSPVHDTLGSHLCCPACHGYAIQLANLRLLFFDPVAGEIWETAQQQEFAEGPPCPACAQRMVKVPLPETEQHVSVCVPCELLWADASAAGLLLGLEPETPANLRTPDELNSAPPREAMPISTTRMAQFLMPLENALRKSLESAQPPEELWQILLAILGYPTEATSRVKQYAVPEVTAWLILLSSVISLLTLFAVPAAIPILGLVPLTPLRFGGLTLLTSLLLHGSFLHLLCNMYILLVFGKSTEHYLGSVPYSVLLILGAIGGTLGQLLGNTHNHLPCVGAGGAITAVMVFYICAFPRAKIALYLLAVKDFLRHSTDNPIFRWAGIPVYLMIGVWVLLQCLLFFTQLAGHIGLSIFSYFAGAAAGLCCWLMWRSKLVESEEEKTPPTPYRLQPYSGSNSYDVHQ